MKPATKEQIAALAHELWIAQSCPEGSDVAFWLEAERQLKGEPARPAAYDAIPADPERIDPDEDPALVGEVERELRNMGPSGGQRSPTSLG